MRCNNCGWDNPAGRTNCEKCNAPLSGEVPSYQATAPQPAVSEVSVSKTVREAAGAPVPMDMPNRCPQCGYPLRPGTNVCPSCHAQIGAAPQTSVPQPAAPQPQRVQMAAGQGTVNPWVQVAQPHQCSLEPVPQMGVETPSAVLLKGDKHELNRSSLDPDNCTITSKVQALITYRDGKWFIEDKSAQQTTFIHVSGQTEIKDGDVILMGNRQFVFKADK